MATSAPPADPRRYDPASFEENWVATWEREGAHAAPAVPDPARKRYVLEMFPYPSGDMHMGHVENYSIADAIARQWRMLGYDVLHPMGYDAFGLPAENAAISRGVHPRDWTFANIERMRRTQTRLGISYDWDRQIISADPGYYRWNQWIFLKLLERGLAYRKTAPVNWCPVDKTVLANEQISAGVCWRCGTVPQVRDLAQWFLKITDYAGRLIDDMEILDWPDQVLVQQRNWIGRSRGAEVTFEVIPTRADLPAISMPVFTTRPDTLWGATFFLLAPEHQFAAELVAGTEYEGPFHKFLAEVRSQTDVERESSERVRRGMALPAVAVNPVNGEEIPVWTADYILSHYGTGAVMAVPAHDGRDFEFARTYGIPVKVVVQPETEELDPETMTEPYVGPGVLVDSGPLTGTVVFPETGIGVDEAIAWLEAEGIGRPTINFRLRDWLVSRQRYWGTPIPIVYCPACGEVPVPYEELPVLLPEEADYTPTDDAVGPLANATEWVNVPCPRCGGPGRRETDTMDTFFDSSWYFLRFCDPHNELAPFDPAPVAVWCPIDQYIGGIEHAVMHLIYARFFTKVFQDMGMVSFPEPFLRLFNQGSISMGGKRMSKSRGNIVEASASTERWGADATRLFILFCSPPSAPYDFPPDGLEEIGRVAFSWLSRVWRLLSEVAEVPASGELERAVHKTIKAVTEDFETFSFNTAIARLMELLNAISKAAAGAPPRAAAETLLTLLAPIAPFITEELWHSYGNVTSIHRQPWPRYDEALLAAERTVMVIQVNGKVRDTAEVPVSISAEEMQTLALGSEKVARLLDGKVATKIVTVPPRLVNVVVD